MRPLDSHIRDSLERSQDSIRGDERLTAWRIEAISFDVQCAAYSIHKKKYRCIWSAPIDQSGLGRAEAKPHGSIIMPHGSIITQWCVTELKALKEAVAQTGVRDAALEYQKLEALGSIDPVCKRAIEELKLDATLQKVAAVSRKVWVSKSEMIMYITSGAAASCGVITMVLMNDKTPGIICLVGALMIGLIGRLMLR